MEEEGEYNLIELAVSPLIRGGVYDLNLIHINNMKTITEAGGVICPATPSFYSQPQTIEEIAATVTDRVLSLMDIENDSYQWGN